MYIISEECYWKENCWPGTNSIRPVTRWTFLLSWLMTKWSKQGKHKLCVPDKEAGQCSNWNLMSEEAPASKLTRQTDYVTQTQPVLELSGFDINKVETSLLPLICLTIMMAISVSERGLIRCSKSLRKFSYSCGVKDKLECEIILGLRNVLHIMFEALHGVCLQ